MSGEGWKGTIAANEVGKSSDGRSRFPGFTARRETRPAGLDQAGECLSSAEGSLGLGADSDAMAALERLD